METTLKIKKIIFDRLPSDNFEVFLFGSRATSRNRKWSDYDIGIDGKGEIPQSIIAKIEEDLDNSDIPYKVDIVDFANVSAKFRLIATKNRIIWTK